MWRFCLFSLVLLTATSCVPGNAKVRANDAAPAEFVVRSERLERQRFGGQMRQLLLAGQYDSLDRIARDLRVQRTRWPNGVWKLRSFYVFGFDAPTDESSESQWKDMLGHLRQWVQTRPASVTGHVALVNALVGYAWHARGDGYSHEVTDIGYRLFEDRLHEAVAVTAAAQRLPEYCPGLPAAAQRVALGTGMERDQYEVLFTGAIRREPTYESYYELKGLHLLPRWHGEPGEWERYASEIANQIGGEEGDATYARIVWFLEEYYGKSVFEESSASWERTARGYQHLLKTYPHSLELQSQFAKLATQAADWERAHAMFERIGPRIDPSVWATRDIFLNVRAWALH